MRATMSVPAATFTFTRSSAAAAASVLACEDSMARRIWPKRSSWYDSPTPAL